MALGDLLEPNEETVYEPLPLIEVEDVAFLSEMAE
jgi:hypothetical protein